MTSPVTWSVMVVSVVKFGAWLYDLRAMSLGLQMVLANGAWRRTRAERNRANMVSVKSACEWCWRNDYVYSCLVLELANYPMMCGERVIVRDTTDRCIVNKLSWRIFRGG